MKRTKRLGLSALCTCMIALGAAAPASAAFDDPLFVFTPPPPQPGDLTPPPPAFEGPCGLAVDGFGNFYVSDYYHHFIDVFASSREHLTQLINVDPLDGPCGLGLDNTGALYVSNFHRNVEKFIPSSFPPVKKVTTFPFTPATTYTSAGVIDSSHPTGVAVAPTGNVYVNNRTHIAAYGSSGAPLLDGGEPLRIGLGSLENGYGLAVSGFPGTLGHVYAADAADNTVKVYDPAVDTVDPVAVIDGSATPNGGFVSLLDSAVAVDKVSGEIYVADNLQPHHTEEPEAAIYVFDSTGAYEGRLKYNIVDALPPGLAVDNSSTFTQGRVYVTSGNTVDAVVYAYPPGAATGEVVPASLSLAMDTAGSGGGVVGSDAVGLECETTCTEQVRAGAQILLTATPDQGSHFTGWAGGGCSGTGSCLVTMSEARSVTASFDVVAGSSAPAERGAASTGTRASASVVTQKGKLRVAVSGKLSPRRLPRNGRAPISVSVGGEITTTDQSRPPQLKTLRIELNREGRLDAAGLPTCPYERIQPGSSSRALAACRGALVGTGSFTADITLSGQEPYPSGGQLLVFNSARAGKPVLLGHIYSRRPFASSFVIVFTLRKLGGRTYGTALDASLPEALGRWGNLTALEMTLSRRYTHRGERHSYISAGCPAPKGFPGAIFPLARTSFTFEGGAKLSSVLTSTCKVRD